MVDPKNIKYNTKTGLISIGGPPSKAISGPLSSRRVMQKGGGSRSKVELPFNLSTPSLLDGFTSLSGYTVTAATQTIESDVKYEGGTALRLVGSGSQAAITTQKPNIITSKAPIELGTVALLVRFNDFDVSTLQLQIGYNAGAGGNYYGPSAATIGTVEAGARWLSFNINEVSQLQNTTPGLIGFRPLITQRNSNAATLWLDAVIYNAAGIPTTLIGFDDMHDTIYTIAAPILKSLGLKATVYFTLNQVNASNKLTEAQLLDLYFNYGWDIAVNGTVDDTSMTTKTTVANAIAGLDAGKAWLTARGMTRAVDHFCYPNGASSDNTPGPTGEFYLGKIQAAAKTAGYKTARLANSGHVYTRFGLADQAMYLPGHVLTGQTQTQITAQNDLIKLRGVTQELIIHRIEDTPQAGNVATSIFQQTMIDLASDRTARRMAILTKSEFFTRDGSSNLVI